MPKNKDENIEKQNQRVLKENNLIIDRLSKSKMKRHVTEENEPVFDDILDGFQKKYAVEVAAKSSLEILKFAKDEL